MTRLEALRALKEAVEAGTLHTEAHGGMPRLTAMYKHLGGFGGPWRDGAAMSAYHGSLNAARALHEAVLPGWRWAIAEGATGCRAAVQSAYASPEDQGVAKCPARAWLIAILSALIAQEATDDAP